jgi:hypothetical protein
MAPVHRRFEIQQRFKGVDCRSTATGIQFALSES